MSSPIKIISTLLEISHRQEVKQLQDFRVEIDLFL